MATKDTNHEKTDDDTATMIITAVHQTDEYEITAECYRDPDAITIGQLRSLAIAELESRLETNLTAADVRISGVETHG